MEAEFAEIIELRGGFSFAKFYYRRVGYTANSD
jgi:hypothetical protein